METLRRTIRATLGYRSPLYRIASRGLDGAAALSKEGMAGLRFASLHDKPGEPRSFTLRSLRHPITARPGTDDIASIVNNVFREEYGQFGRRFSAHRIVDAGAYIGDTTAYFLTRFPHATVVALEPSPESHALARQNLAPYGARVTLLRSALWSEPTEVHLSGEQTQAAVSAQGVAVPAITVPACMALRGWDHVDLLKMDIEGAECAVIPSGVGGWLSAVTLLLLETHGPASERAVLPRLVEQGFSIRRYRNVWYCLNRRPPAGTRVWRP